MWVSLVLSMPTYDRSLRGENGHFSSISQVATYCSDGKGYVTYTVCFLIQLQIVEIPSRFLQTVDSVFVHSILTFFFNVFIGTFTVNWKNHT